MFPAIAIADAIKRMHPDAQLLFVGAQGRLEMERVPKAGYKIEGLWISGFQRSLSPRNLMFPVKLATSLLKARRILKSFGPQVAVGVGGYASGPLLRVAAAAGIPTLIQEQNSFPGVTNRLLASKVHKVCVAYEGMERWFPENKIVLTGNPVREAVIDIAGKRDEAAAYFGLDGSKPTLLVIGGSLGARTINQSIEAALAHFAEAGYQLIWQSGKAYDESAQAAVARAKHGGIKQMAFIERMDLAYAIADAVVSRAGAISVSELSLTAKPTIFVPSPNVAEDHQTKNAMALVQKEAALLVRDADAAEQLWPQIQQLMHDESLRVRLSNNIGLMAYPRAAEIIANEVLALASKYTKG